MKILLVDYNRILRCDYIANTFEKAVNKLSSQKWDIMYIDHDLGEFKKSGYDVMKFLKDNKQFAPKVIMCISLDPSKKQRIENMIKDIHGRVFDQRDVDDLENLETRKETV